MAHSPPLPFPAFAGTLNLHSNLSALLSPQRSSNVSHQLALSIPSLPSLRANDFFVFASDSLLTLHEKVAAKLALPTDAFSVSCQGSPLCLKGQSDVGVSLSALGVDSKTKLKVSIKAEGPHRCAGVIVRLPSHMREAIRGVLPCGSPPF